MPKELWGMLLAAYKDGMEKSRRKGCIQERNMHYYNDIDLLQRASPQDYAGWLAWAWAALAAAGPGGRARMPRDARGAGK